jgi:hypothetical protein
MKHALHFPLPYEVVVEGKTYKIKPYFDTVLKVFALQKEPDLTDGEKADLSFELLVASKKPQMATQATKIKVLNVIFDVLIDKPKKPNDEKQAFDFVQDSGYIYSSFVMDYNIDLYEQQGKLHWWKFIQLFQGLSDKTKIVQVMQIRLKPIPAPTKYNGEERTNLAKQKNQYALDFTQEEVEKSFATGLKKLATFMESMARR